MKITTITHYIAEDGDVFDNKRDCIGHETKIKKGGIYIYGSKITEEDLNDYMNRGYWLANYSPGKLIIFGPPPYNGGVGELYGNIADKLGRVYDKHNFRVYELRCARGLI